MQPSEFLHYNNKPCRFKMRTGKEVFGVIWEKRAGNYTKYYFASLAERFRISIRGGNLNDIGMLIDLNDVAGAELLNENANMVS